MAGGTAATGRRIDRHEPLPGNRRRLEAHTLKLRLLCRTKDSVFGISLCSGACRVSVSSSQGRALIALFGSDICI
jgi:hypothetical protein